MMVTRMCMRVRDVVHLHRRVRCAQRQGRRRSRRRAILHLRDGRHLREVRDVTLVLVRMFVCVLARRRRVREVVLVVPNVDQADRRLAVPELHV